MHTASNEQTSGISACPVMGLVARSGTNAGRTNRDWWPNQLDLKVLAKHSDLSNPMDTGFSYAEAFASLDLAAVKQDLYALMTDSKEWWPADWGHYGPFFIRMAWHSAGTYRTADGRGGAGAGMLRFAPLNSWPDNANLDKARRLLWPLKKKYGCAISWADLMILAGNCALESMGLKTFGFAGGRQDRWEPEDSIYWGPENEWLGDNRYAGERRLETPLGAVQMGLIYVNPQGPNGNPDPAAAAVDIRETFARMAMDDEETVALIAGGHSFGKAHGAGPESAHVGCEPEGASTQEQGLGWKNNRGAGHGADAITSGLEGAWTTDPIKWDNGFFDTLFGYEWEKHKGPGGAWQWKPAGGAAKDAVSDAHVEGKANAPMMLTTDIALRTDTAYEKISRRFHENHDQFADAFARAWYKLTHRDMGPYVRLLGPEVPGEQPWQDPVPAAEAPPIGEQDVAAIKATILASGLSTSALVKTAWAAASSFRSTDKRGGANGGRLRLEPQRNWKVNDPETLGKTIPVLEKIAADCSDRGKHVSFADLVVLAGCAAVEDAAKRGGYDVEVPFTPGRTDASQEQTDVASFGVLEPAADGFRNYIAPGFTRPAEELLVDRADLLSLTAPEMTVLIGGLRVLNANTGHPTLGAFTDNHGALTNDFFVNILDMDIQWRVSQRCEHVYEGVGRASGEVRWMGSAVDLVFGSNAQLRALSEVYAAENAGEKFVRDFVRAWAKVMDLDRF